MTTKYFLMLALVISLSCIALEAQIGAKIQQRTNIVGTWENNDNGCANTLILNADGTGEFNGDVLTYKAQASNLQLKMSGTTTDYSFQLKNNKLTLSGGDLAAAMIFTRGGETPNTPAIQTTIPNATGNPIVGTWNGFNEVLSFSPDGSMTLNGYSLRYSVDGNALKIDGPNGTANYTFTLNGNNLTINMNGQIASYQKGGTGVSTNTANPSNLTARSPDQGQMRGRIAMELVGKWCWINVSSTNSGGASSSRYITINADGTYEYYYEGSMSANTYNSAGDQTMYAGTASQGGDRGIWRLDGNTLCVTSQSQGFRTYTLQKVNHPKNGDPMIVIDGEAFVTYYKRQPW